MANQEKSDFLHGPTMWKVVDCRGSNPQPFSAKVQLHQPLALQDLVFKQHCLGNTGSFFFFFGGYWKQSETLHPAKLS